MTCLGSFAKSHFVKLTYLIQWKTEFGLRYTNHFTYLPMAQSDCNKRNLL
jgi:hypothetical protein